MNNFVPFARWMIAASFIIGEMSCFGGRTAAQDSSASSRLLEEVVASINQRNANVRSLSVDYQRFLRGTESAASNRLGKETRFAESSQVRFDVHRDKYRQLERKMSPSDKNVRPLGTHDADLCFLFDGRRSHKYYPRTRTVQVSTPDRSEPISFRHEYTGNLGWWPYDYSLLRPVRDNQYFLADCLTNGTYRVLPEREAVDGRMCIAIVHAPLSPTDFYDKIWLDEACGWGLRRREIVRPTTPVAQDAKAIVTASDYREAQAGVWFPWDLRVLHQRRSRFNQDEFVTLVDTHLIVKRLSTNDSQIDDQLQMAFQPGSLIEDADIGTEETLPGGEEVLFQAIERLQQDLARRSKPSNVSTQRMVGATGMAFIAGIAIVFCRRQRLRDVG